jgi:hypothetical protein
MQDSELEQRFRPGRKRREATGAGTQQALSELTAAIEMLTVELDALKMAVQVYHPGIARFYPKLRHEANMRKRKRM